MTASTPATNNANETSETDNTTELTASPDGAILKNGCASAQSGPRKFWQSGDGDDWASGEINWLLDVIAPNQKMTARVIAGFKQVVKEGDLRLHPIVTKLVDKNMLEKMGAKPADKKMMQ